MDYLNTGNAYRLVLVIAPRRTDRTTHLRDWIRQQGDGKGIQVAWLPLEEADNQPDQFLADLDQALSPFLPPTLLHPDRKTLIFSALAPNRSDNQALEDALASRINALAKAPGKIILVLDYYDAITSDEVHHAVGLLLDYLPPQALVILACAYEPPLPLARLRVRRQLLEIGLEDLNHLYN